MYPIICKIGPFTVYAYGLSLALAFFIASALACRQAEKAGLSQEKVFNFTFLVFIAGVVGSRIFYVVENIGYYAKEPLEIIMLQHGGLSWFGGLISGVLAGVIYLRNKNLVIYKVLDLIVPFVALGQAIGRIGCLLNGCCFGKESQFGIFFSLQNRVLIPTQLYSALLLIAIFLILRYLQDKPHRDSQIFYTYLLLYSAKRFFIEFWRADNEIILFGLTLFQIISILIFCFAYARIHIKSTA